MFLDYFHWQFVRSPSELYKILINILSYIYNYFSIGNLAKTLFAPWKRDTIYVVNATLADQARVLIDNLISRFMGFVMRSITIFAGIILLIIYIIAAIIFLVFWTILPLAIIYLIYLGIFI